MRRLRAGVIGSISAWLPSRRSVDSQRGALVIFWSGQVRSGTTTGSKAVYRPNGIGEACCTGRPLWGRVPKLDMSVASLLWTGCSGV